MKNKCRMTWVLIYCYGSSKNPNKIITVQIWRFRPPPSIPERKKLLETSNYCFVLQRASFSDFPISLLKMKPAFQTVARSLWTAYWESGVTVRRHWEWKTKEKKKKRNEKKGEERDQSKVRTLWKAEEKGEVFKSWLQ